MRPRRAGREAAAAAAALVLALPLIYGLTAAVIALGRAAGAEEPFVGHDLLPVFERAAGNWSIVPLVASVVLVAAVLEEMIFRGLLQTVLHGAGGKSRPWAAILVASVCFAMFHASVPWQSLPGLFVLGIIFGWLYERHGSLLPSVLAHAGFNAVNVAMVVF